MYILFRTNEAWELIKNNDQLLSNCYKHFKIPFEISKSVQVIKKNKLAKMDVGVVNGYHFFGNMGCALESHFIRNYQKNGWHGIWAYVIAFFDAVAGFKHQKIQIESQIHHLLKRKKNGNISAIMNINGSRNGRFCWKANLYTPF